MIALTFAYGLGFAAAVLPAQSSAKSSVATDPRWTPWLGCWQQDTAGFAAAGVPAAVTCVTPVTGSASVEALSIAGGQIVSRKRLDAAGTPHPIDETGCHGNETANWSPTSRRIYLRADYVCLSMRASSSSVFAISPAGEWLEVQNVRADGGSIDRVLRWHEAPPPRGLPKAAAASIASRRLSIATARAAASRPLGTDDVIEASRAVDATTVQSWILATGQRFVLDDTQLAALDRADVPLSIVHAMATGEQTMTDDGEQANDAGSSVMMNPYSAYNGYDSYQSYNPYPSYTYPGYAYGGYGSYGAYGTARYGGYGYGRVPIVGYPVTPPIVIVRGGNHGHSGGRGTGTSGTPRTPGTPGVPPGGRPPRLQPPVGRPVGARPPAAKPPVAHIPSRSRP
jgi:hypothetical protein